MTDPQPAGRKGRPPIARAALFGLCPECGAPTLFAGPVRFADRCPSCGLNFGAFNVGDGAATFLIMLVGAIVLPCALWLHFSVGPPLIAHLLLWPIIIFALTMGGLRIAKAGLIAAEHQREGREGRLDKERPDGED
jgi:uncharacterized protein (DUF983 family)